jgi:hypothetical protein
MMQVIQSIETRNLLTKEEVRILQTESGQDNCYGSYPWDGELSRPEGFPSFFYGFRVEFNQKKRGGNASYFCFLDKPL